MFIKRSYVFSYSIAPIPDGVHVFESYIMYIRRGASLGSGAKYRLTSSLITMVDYRAELFSYGLFNTRSEHEGLVLVEDPIEHQIGFSNHVSLGVGWSF